jgi:hypothetical protein
MRMMLSVRLNITPGETTLTVLPADQYQLRKSNTIECFDVKF